MGYRANRRQILLGIGLSLAGASLAPRLSRAEETLIDLTWTDLIPAGENSVEIPGLMGGVVEHNLMSLPEYDETAVDVTTKYNGKTVRLPGYAVPLDFSGVGVTSFLLVPYVGACIHVPPPPPNQLVFVTMDEPYEFEGLFQAVWVTGVMNTRQSRTALADVGYALTKGEVVPYIWE